jgi:5-methylthioadenosine/S-adenosylhomocysteine deaminase
MRLILGLVRAQREDEFALSAQRVLQMATLDGADALGLAEVTGSLTPGKRADLILIRTTDLHTAPAPHAANTVTLAAQPAHVDTVISNGRILKEQGRLTTADPDQVTRDATESLSAIGKDTDRPR